MLLIRPQKPQPTIRKKIIQISASEVASRIQSYLAILTIPAVMIYSGKGFVASFVFAMHNLHNILPIIIVLVFVAKTLFNFGQKTKTL